MRTIFSEKGQKNGKIFENLGKNVQHLENIFKKGSLMSATTASMKQLKYALVPSLFQFNNLESEINKNNTTQHYFLLHFFYTYESFEKSKSGFSKERLTKSNTETEAYFVRNN